MNQKSYQNQEINLVEAFFAALYKWKAIVICGIVVGLLFGAYQEYSYRIHTNDEGLTGYEEAVEQYDILKSQYNHSVTAYKLSLSSYNEAIEHLTDEIEKAQKYIDESPKMQLDPYEYYGTELSIYIDNGYEILPENTYQNVNTLSAIISAYKTELTTGKYREELSDALGINQFYLDDVYTVSASGDGFIYISLIGPSEEFINAGMDFITASLSNIEEGASSTIGDFDATLTNYDTSVLSSDDIETYQNQKKEELTNLQTQLVNDKTELSELEEPDKFTESKPVIWHKVVKNIIIGGICGCILSALLFGFMPVLMGKVCSANDLKQSTEMNVLGSISNKKYDAISKLFRKMHGAPLYDNRKRDFGIITANLLVYASDVQGTILVTGSADDTGIDFIGSKLKSVLPDHEFELGPNMLMSGKTISAIPACGAVVLVEQIGKSCYQDIFLQKQKTEDLGKKVLGIILLDK